MKLAIFLTLLPLSLFAQVFNPGNLPPPTNAPAPAPASPGSEPEKKSGFGSEMPFLDPGSEVASWNGHAWNITNNRLFRGRFEKYLASPEDDGPADQEYRATLRRCISLITPKTGALPNLPAAVSLLSILAEYPIDARHCDAIAGAIYTVWSVKRNEAALVATNKALQKEIDNLALRVEAGGRASSLGATTRPAPAPQQNGQNPPPPAVGVSDYTRLGIDIKKIVEREAVRAANQAKAGITEIKAKLEFQALIIQLFLQRRFEHTLIACRCYNELFSGQDRELQIKQGSDVEKMFAKGLGVNPTISTLEVFSNDAIRDVDEGVQAFEYLVEKKELQTASNRLMEAFAIGEYMPRVRTLPRSKKEQVLVFVRDSNMLISSLEMRDIGRAEELLTKVKSYTTDFDESKPRAAIESSKNASNLHIQAAQMAAVSRDQKKVEEEISKAATLWPTNPGLNEFSKALKEEGSAQNRILMDFESLLAQQNYRQIAKDAPKYAAVMLNNPEKSAKLNEVLEIVKRSEVAAIKADELARAKNPHAAWESVQEAKQELPQDAELSRRSAELSAQVPEFAAALNTAQNLESRRQFGIAIAWFVKAKKLYPASRYAEEGIGRLGLQILPDLSLPPTPPPAIPGLTQPTLK
jgi:hypothetical protein